MQRARGTLVVQDTVGLEEKILYRPLGDARSRHKLDRRWKYGVFLGGPRGAQQRSHRGGRRWDAIRTGEMGCQSGPRAADNQLMTVARRCNSRTHPARGLEGIQQQ